MNKLVYEHKHTKEKIELYKILPYVWFRDVEGKRVFYKHKDLKDYKFLKNESQVRGGWSKTNQNFFRK